MRTEERQEPPMATASEVMPEYVSKIIEPEQFQKVNESQ
jgi:hypothetical protein